MESLDMDTALPWEDIGLFGELSPMLSTGMDTARAAVDTASAAFVEPATGDAFDNSALFTANYNKYDLTKDTFAHHVPHEFSASPENDIYALLDEGPDDDEPRMQHTLAETSDSPTMAESGPLEPVLDDILQEIRLEAEEVERRSRSATKSPMSVDENTLSSMLYDDDDELIDLNFDESDGSEYIEPVRAPAARRRGGRSSLDRRERKKEQNRRAAQRYREKKAAQKTTTHGTLEHLLRRNTALKASVSTLQTEIDIMKKLMREVRAA